MSMGEPEGGGRLGLGRTRIRAWGLGACRLLVIGLALGWLYGWAGPRLYPEHDQFGFGWGMAHGALMPMALPALVMGRDVHIYAPGHTSRGYKLGYIAGINLCGLLVFGGAFWRPVGGPSTVVTSTNGRRSQ